MTAKVVSHPVEWDGCSFRLLVGRGAAPEWLATDQVLRLFHHRPVHARSLLTRFVLAGGTGEPGEPPAAPPPNPPISALLALFDRRRAAQHAVEAGHTIDDVADTLQVASRTVRRWLA